MKRLLYKIMTVVLLFGSLTARSQNDGIALTLLPHLSYNNFYNPGIPIDSKIVFGVGVSNIGFSLYNSSIKYKNLYNFNNNTPISIDANKFIDNLNERDNFINSNLSIDIARIGFRLNKFFIDVNWRLRYNGEIHYSKDFLGFFIKGNAHYMGPDNPADFSIGADVNFFSELAIGLQYDINDKLTVGIRPKLLCGIANVSINDDNTMIYTDPDTYEMTGDVNLNIKAATMLNADINRISEISDFLNTMNIAEVLSFKENMGFGVDFGASYTFNKQFGVAAGVYDLGFITWKNSKEKHNHKEDVVINDALIDDFNDIMNMNINVSDLYENLLENVWENDSLYPGSKYKTSLKTRIMLQGYYELIPMARFTAIAQMYYVNKQLRPAFTLAYSGSFFKFMNLTASYTASKYAGNALGAGISFNFGPFNIYAITDNIMILSKIGASTPELLTSYNAANVRFGIVFTLGKRNN